jgi:tripartite-type tricarboxylate transporter receptor subunit TctC
MINRRDILVLGSSCLAGVGLVPRSSALAQSKYPERPIRLVVPFAPGGILDALGRQWMHAIESLLGPVFVENQAGAGGSIGTAAVARADPDGHTLLLGSAAQMVIAATSTARDFAPISILVIAAMSIVVHPSVPVQNLEELVDYAKANPGKLSYGSNGAGSFSHLTGELFKSLTGTNDIVHVPYKGSGPALTDLISGQIPMASPAITGQVLDLHQSGKLRILAVAMPARLGAAPDIPTAVEQGLPGMIAQNFAGLLAPARTPAAIVDQISDATRTAMADQEFREKLIASGWEPYPESSPEAARRFIQGEIARWTPVINTIGLKMGMRSTPFVGTPHGRHGTWRTARGGIEFS